MKIFFNNKRLFSIIFGIEILVIVFLIGNRVPHLAFDQANQFAQIIAIETELLKDWQQSDGLKNTLAYNMKGSEVTLLQRMLSQDRSIYPKKEITGYYGNLTKDAVMRFQDEYNLSKTGVVDVETRNNLNEIFLSHLCPKQIDLYPDLSKRKITRRSPLPQGYVPPNLENVSDDVKTIGITCVNEGMVDSLKDMFRAAEKESVYLAVTSGYRKPVIQKYLYDYWLRIEGPDVLDEIAEPGASEHQLGTTIDLTDASIGYVGVDDRFAYSEGGKWLQKNAHKYGFVMSYPQNKKDVTGYEFEPWHWRFVGADIATELRSQELVFNEFTLDAQKRPYPKENITRGLNLSADAVVSIFFDRDGTEYILLEKNKEQRLPIASITKLMVALVASDLFRPDDVVTLNQEAVNSKGASGQYTVGESFLYKDALNALLIGSHNDIAISMAGQVGTDTFVQRMNEKAQAMGLKDTHFVNVSGLDPEADSKEINYSTARDVAQLLKYLFENKVDIFSLLEKDEYKFKGIDSGREVVVETTNKLIKNQNTSLQILGGKTGETPRAKMNLVVISDAPSQDHIVSVVIGSEDSFRDMRGLLKYTEDSFVW